jgi:hypothetical protein
LPILNADFEDNDEIMRTSDGLLVYNNPIFQNVSTPNEPVNEVSENQEEEKEKFNYEEFYTRELENLYTSCLEWIISRAPSTLYENIVIDECDKVSN